MISRAPLLIIGCFLISASILDAQNRRSGVSFAGERAERIQSRVMPTEQMSMQRADRLQGQRFGMEEWRKQFSPIGQRRSSLEGTQSRLADRQFQRETVVMPEVGYEMARFNDRMAHLRDRAGIETDARSHRFDRAPQALVDLQNVQHFTDQVREADLEMINRYQFRRNRPEGLPAEAAGGEPAQARSRG